MAIWYSRDDVLEALLDTGPDLTIKDTMHEGTALGWAEERGRHDVAEKLRSFLGGR